MTPFYDDGAVTIYHGDCRDVIPALGPVDHVITDPPYGEETHEGARRYTGDHLVTTFDAITAEDVRAIYELIDARRWLVATMEWRHVHALEAAPPRGWSFIRFGIWVKPNGAPQFTGDRPATGWEAVAILHRAGRRLRWNGNGAHAVWTIPKVSGAHPTRKPDELVEAFVAAFTDPGDVILDPFGGVGTTAVAAKKLGRRCILVESEAHYCELAARRVSFRFETIPGGLFAGVDHG